MPIEEEKNQTPPHDPAPEPKKVEVNEEALNRLIAKVEDQEKQIAMLTEVADVSRLQHYLAKNQESRGRTVKIRQMEGKYVVGWRTVVNEVYYDTNAKSYVERQTVEVVFADNTRKEMELRHFALKHEKVTANVLKEVKNEDGKVILQVELEDKEKTKLNISTQFVN